jgi:hypothetical protein
MLSSLQVNKQKHNTSTLHSTGPHYLWVMSLRPTKCNIRLVSGATAKQLRKAIISLLITGRFSMSPYGRAQFPADGVFVKFRIWDS